MVNKISGTPRQSRLTQLPFHGRRRAWIAGTIYCLLLAACGGGGGGGGSTTPTQPTEPDDPPTSDSGWVSGEFEPAENFKDMCASPRTGINPATNRPYPDESGSTLDENNWLRSWSNETYLWYSDIVDRDPGLYDDPVAYFDELRSNATTASGAPRDQYHFSLPTDEWFELATTNTSVGYGMHFSILANTPPREMIVVYTDVGSPASAPGADVRRGAEILEIDGVDFVYDNTFSGVNTINAALNPESEGETHTFTVRDYGSSTTRTVSLTAQKVTSPAVDDVQTLATATGNVGYINFLSHSASSEQALVEAVQQLQAEGVSDLVLDLRYNGGGLLDVASQLSYMIAGVNATAGHVFETLQFNDKHPEINPVTGTPIEPTPFHDETLGFSLAPGQGLPTLDLQRLFVLTGNNTCSASESIMNSLQGVDFEVIMIGGTTCGKPYGSYAQDNCGTTYLTVQFKGVNDKGFGDYPDGFSPGNASGQFGVQVKGCRIEDDYSHELGDPEEARFAAALDYRNSGSCPQTVAGASSDLKSDKQQPEPVFDGILQQPRWRTMRIYR